MRGGRRNRALASPHFFIVPIQPLTGASSRAQPCFPLPAHPANSLLMPRRPPRTGRRGGDGAGRRAEQGGGRGDWDLGLLGQPARATRGAKRKKSTPAPLGARPSAPASCPRLPGTGHPCFCWSRGGQVERWRGAGRPAVGATGGVASDADRQEKGAPVFFAVDPQLSSRLQRAQTRRDPLPRPH